MSGSDHSNRQAEGASTRTWEDRRQSLHAAMTDGKAFVTGSLFLVYGAAIHSISGWAPVIGTAVAMFLLAVGLVAHRTAKDIREWRNR